MRRIFLCIFVFFCVGFLSPAFARNSEAADDAGGIVITFPTNSALVESGFYLSGVVFETNVQIVKVTIQSAIGTTNFDLPLQGNVFFVSNLAVDLRAPKSSQVTILVKSEKLLSSVDFEVIPKPSILFIILMSVFFVVTPGLFLWAESKHPFFEKVGALLLCYAAGILVGNLNILPKTFMPTQNLFTMATVPLALPLIFFSMDMKKWKRLAGRSFLSLIIQIFSIAVVSAAGYFMFAGRIGDETWKLSGMMVGVYTGGTVNLASIGKALDASPNLYVSANTADVIVSAVYLLFFLTIGQKVFELFLPKFKHEKDQFKGVKLREYSSYRGIFKPQIVKLLLKALGFAILIVAVGGGLSFVVPQEYGDVVAILAITTLGIVASFIPSIRKIPKTYQLGQYIILIFCTVIGSMANFSEVISAVPGVFGYVAFMVLGSLILHAGISALFKIDADTVIITSTAAINSPPMVPMVAAALKNKEVVVSGVMTGLIGWVSGTYLGVMFAYFLKNLSQ